MKKNWVYEWLNALTGVDTTTSFFIVLALEKPIPLIIIIIIYNRI